jgi:hypothetical protein
MLLQAFQIESVPVRSRRVVKSDLARIDRMLASGKYDTIAGWFNP